MPSPAEECYKKLQDLREHCRENLDKAQDLLQSLKTLGISLSDAPANFEITLRGYSNLLESRVVPLLLSIKPPGSRSNRSDNYEEPRTPTSPSVKITIGASDTGGNARRSIPRYNQRLAVRYCVPGKDQAPQKAFSKDVGALGLFIMSTRIEKTGQSLNLEVEIPQKGFIQMQGTVVWTKWVPPALRSSDYPGFAVKIHSAPESWFTYFMSVEESYKARESTS